jgi:dTDP-4-dehydrorhamnose reductase
METTYNVKVWKIATYKGARGTTYTVRWTLDGNEQRAPFATRALADAFRSELVSATRRGEAFSLSTGRPVSHQSGATAVNWYDFAVQFADAQWDGRQQPEEHLQGADGHHHRFAANAADRLQACRRAYGTP